jgi:hypothetical protein
MDRGLMVLARAASLLDWATGFLAACAAIATVLGVWFLGGQIRLERRLRTLEFATTQFDRLQEARRDLGEIGGGDVLTFLKSHPESRQGLLEYVYTLNRVSEGILDGSLDERVIFDLWSPRWFIHRWEQFKPFLIAEWKRRGESGQDAYRAFQYLAEHYCPPRKEKFPRWGRTKRGGIEL